MPFSVRSDCLCLFSDYLYIFVCVCITICLIFTVQSYRMTTRPSPWPLLEELLRILALAEISEEFIYVATAEEGLIHINTFKSKNKMTIILHSWSKCFVAHEKLQLT